MHTIHTRSRYDTFEEHLGSVTFGGWFYEIPGVMDWVYIYCEASPVCFFFWGSYFDDYLPISGNVVSGFLNIGDEVNGVGTCWNASSNAL